MDSCNTIKKLIKEKDDKSDPIPCCSRCHEHNNPSNEIELDGKVFRVCCFVSCAYEQFKDKQNGIRTGVRVPLGG